MIFDPKSKTMERKHLGMRKIVVDNKILDWSSTWDVSDVTCDVTFHTKMKFVGNIN